MRSLYCLIFLFLSIISFSQRIEWVNLMGGGNFTRGLGVQVDENGYVYTVGSFSHTTDFDPSTGVFELDANSASFAETDAFIQKVDSAGNFEWAFQFGGSGDQYATGIDLFGNNIYITGYFEDTVDFDPGANTMELVSNGAEDIFVVKIDLDGNLQWAKSFGGVKDDLSTKIMLDRNENVYAVGTFKETVDFDPGAGEFSISTNSKDGYINKLNSEGEFVWAVAYDANYIGGISHDSLDNVYVMGTFSSTADLDPGPDVFELSTDSRNYNDVYIQKLNADGEFVWATSFGGTEHEYGYDIVFDGESNLYLTGSFRDTAYYESPNGIETVVSNGGSDIFLIQMTLDGQFVDVITYGSDGFDHGQEVFVDDSKRLFVAGGFSGLMDFDPRDSVSVYEDPGVYGSGTFVQEFDQEGKLVSLKTIGAARVQSAAQKQDDVFLTGYSSFRLYFNECDSLEDMNAAGSNFAFTTKIDQIAYCLRPITINACDDYTSPSGKLWTESGQYFDTLLSSNETDSIVWIDLLINTSYLKQVEEQSCDSFTSSKGLEYHSSGVYYDTLLSVSGCDSIIEFNFTRLEKSFDTLNFVVCNSFTSPSGDYTWTESGQFYDTLINDVGCDSIITINLSVEEPLNESSANVSLLASAAQGGGDQRAWGLDIDANENIYVAGHFYDTVKFQGANGNELKFGSRGDSDIFIYKAQADGQVIWANVIGGTDKEDGYEAKSDEDGNVYLLGSFKKTIYLNDNSDPLATAPSSSNTLLVKFDSHGIMQWHIQLEGIFNIAEAMNIDREGSLYLLGMMGASVDFDPGPGDERLPFNRGMFILKLTADGEFEWVSGAYGEGGSFEPSGIAFDSQNNVYATGGFTHTFDFNPSIDEEYLMTAADTFYYDAVIVKYHSNGAWNWAKKFGSSGVDNITSLKISQDDEIYVSGHFQDTVDMDPGYKSWELISDYSLANFVSRMDIDGQLLWSNKIDNNALGLLSDLSITSDGTILLVGSRNSSSMRYSDCNVVSEISADKSGFLMAFDRESRLRWSKNIAYGNGAIWPSRLGVSSVGNIYTIGNFSTDLSAQINLNEETIASEEGLDSFLVRLNDCEDDYEEIETSACNIYLSPGGHTWNESGIYSDTVTTVTGCKTIYTIDLTIKESSVSSEAKSVCESYEWNGVTYESSGTYEAQLTNAAGCDSTATLHLTILETLNSEVEVESCESYEWNGVTYESSGTYEAQLTNAAGCDSTATLHLIILEPSNSEEAVESCESYEWNGVTYESSGTYEAQLTNSAGCDSTATLHLIILESSNSEEEAEECESYEWNGVIYESSGTYEAKLTNVAGCDSTATLHLIILEPSNSEEEIETCESYEWNGVTYESSGTYEAQLTNAAGCDSTATLHLTILESLNGEEEVESCESYEWNGVVYGESGTFESHFTNAAGCDSTATINLTILGSSFSHEAIESCESYEWNGVVYEESGTYESHFTNAVGCDSTATINLTILDSSFSHEAVESCESYEWNGVVYVESGTYESHFTNAVGCDSIAILNLIIQEASSSAVSISHCGDYMFGNQILTMSGVYTEIFKNNNNCDSTVMLTFEHLELPPAEISINGIVLFASKVEGATYQWFNCETNEELEGQTKRQLTPPRLGSYYVEISDGNCTSKSKCASVEGVLSTKERTNAKIYPIVTNGSFTLDLGNTLEEIDIRIISVDGQVVHSDYFERLNDVELAIKGSPGIYIVQVKSKKQIVEIFRVLKK